MLHEKTDYSANAISDILNALGNIVKENFDNCNGTVEIKIFPGLKLTSKCIPSDQSVSKRLKIESGYSIFMSAIFTDDFRKKVRKLHNKSALSGKA